MNISVNDYCDIIAKILAENIDKFNNLIENMIDLNSTDDQIIATISTILKNHFDD